MINAKGQSPSQGYSRGEGMVVTCGAHRFPEADGWQVEMPDCTHYLFFLGQDFHVHVSDF